jgi:hypothetical protein
MNRTISNGGASRLFLAEIRFRDFEICWAGPNPVGPGFCFGSEGGRLLFTDEDGSPPDHPPDKGTMSGEAINGAAGLGRWLTVTSRQDVTFEVLWADLARDGITAHRGIGALVAAPRQALPLLRERLRPSPRHSKRKARQWHES